ncbi:MAG: LysR family transcriptional regulator [Gemmobacter sp.]
MSLAHHSLPMRHAYTPTMAELQAFVATADGGTSARASQMLGLTQSAVSRSLGTLEARLGVALFRRERQRLILSDAGRAFLPEAQGLLAALDRAALAVMSFGGHRDVLRLACLPTFATGWLIPRLPAFVAAAPGITFDISATLAPPDFDRDARDAAILRGPAPGGVAALVLAAERLITVASPALVPAGPLTDAELARLPLLQQATRPELWRDWFGAEAATALRGPRFETFAMVLAAARAGMGVALVPQMLVQKMLVPETGAQGCPAPGGLVRASVKVLTGPSPYLLIWPGRSDALPAFRAFRDWLATPAAGSDPA